MAEPWSKEADAFVVSHGPDTTEPIIKAGNRYTYFLEGFVICDVLKDFGFFDDVDSTACEKIILYAVNDA